MSYLVRDDGGSPTAAVQIVRKFITEDKVDVIIGPSLTSSSMRHAGPSSLDPRPHRDGDRSSSTRSSVPYTFDDAQPAELMIDAVGLHMHQHDIKSVAFIGYNDAWGEEVWNSLKVAATKYGFKIVADERYARTDTTVTAQTLKAMTTHPQAVMCGGSATPGALPNIALNQRGYKGQILTATRWSARLYPRRRQVGGGLHRTDRPAGGR